MSLASLPNSGEGGRSGLRILIADDHDTFRDEVKRLLEREGFTVVGAAANGCEALKLAGELQPDVAVLDLGMPVLDGFKAAQAMAQVCPKTKLVALTIHSAPPFIAHAVSMGFAGYVLKSRSADELVDAIQDVREGLTHLPQASSASY